MQTAPQVTLTETSARSLSYPTLGAIGILVWLAGTLLMRFAGQYFFFPTNSFSMIECFLLMLLVMPSVMVGIFRWQGIKPAQAYEATMVLVIPSMLMDAVVSFCFPQIFPNVEPLVEGPFAAWLFWGYAICLGTGLVMGKQK